MKALDTQKAGLSFIETHIVEVVRFTRDSANWRPQSPAFSSEIADQHHVTAYRTSCQGKPPAVRRPVKIENASRFEMRNLARRTACQALLPDVRDAAPDYALQIGSHFRF